MIDKKYRLRLITKVILLFALLPALLFSITGVLLYQRAKSYINYSVDHTFKHKMNNAINVIKSGSVHTYIRDVTITAVPDNHNYPKQIITDTVMLDDEGVDKHLYRCKSEIIEVNGKNYQIFVRKNIDELVELRDDIVIFISPILIVLALFILLYSLLMSGRLLNPLSRILQAMDNYRVGQNIEFKPVKTSTEEFVRLQEQFKTMINQIEDDYINLKQYTENMSHELLTPVTIIRNKAESIIQREVVMNVVADDIKSIYQETLNLAKISNSLKLITKIENNEFIDRQCIKTEGVIQSIINKLQDHIDLKDMTVSALIDKDHTLFIDPGLFDILMNNLIRNAVRHGKYGTVIDIKTENNMFSVGNYSDNKPIDKSKIFKRFVRSEGSSSLGLGLNIVKQICNINNIHIEYSYNHNYHKFLLKQNMH